MAADQVIGRWFRFYYIRGPVTALHVRREANVQDPYYPPPDYYSIVLLIKFNKHIN